MSCWSKFYRGNSYAAALLQATWDEAEAVCVQNGGHLMSMENVAEPWEMYNFLSQ